MLIHCFIRVADLILSILKKHHWIQYAFLNIRSYQSRAFQACPTYRSHRGRPFPGRLSKSGPQTPPANIQDEASASSDYYLQQLQQSSDDNKADWQLLAIRALLREGKLPQAGDQLNQLPKISAARSRLNASC